MIDSPLPGQDAASTAGGEPAREVLDWTLFGVASRELAATIATSGFLPEVIVAVARGGLIPAGALGYALGIKAAGAMNVEFYTDVEQTLADPVILPPFLDRQAIAGKKVLVVDDVADSGRTLKAVVELLVPAGGDIRSAVLYTKPRSVVRPDYSWRQTDRWITFPWSALPPVTSTSESGA